MMESHFSSRNLPMLRGWSYIRAHIGGTNGTQWAVDRGQE